jgi:hypothetical protein
MAQKIKNIRFLSRIEKVYFLFGFQPFIIYFIREVNLSQKGD